MAQVMPVDLVAPGAWGLNTESANTLLAPQWATVALNAVVSRSGRLAARKGWANQTTTGISGNHQIDVLFEYLDEAGASVIISTANNKIYKNITDFTDAANDITSTTAPTADHWQFLNFNNKILGFQRGHTPIVRTSGDFTDASYTGTGPDGNCAVAAFGRVWAADADLQTIRYSALLDDTDYSTASGGGTIDMTSVWTGGMDRIVAIEVIGATLVVFGNNHIVLWADGSGSEIGITASQLEVVDTIEGTGCIARDSVANTGEGDLIFLSRHGIQSLSRVIEDKNNPVTSLSRHIRADIQEAVRQQRAADTQFDQVRATFSPEEGLYILNFPVPNKQFVVDANHPFEDDSGIVSYPITTWQLGGPIVGMLTLTTGATYFGAAGVVGKYSEQSDNGSAYDFEFQSGWLDWGELNHRIKMLKEILASVQIGTGTLVWNWEFDFNGTQHTRSVSYTGPILAEFNISEFSDSAGGIGYADPQAPTLVETEFSGALLIQRKLIPAFGEGQFIKLGVTASVTGFDVVLQHMSVAPKIGRMVT